MEIVSVLRTKLADKVGKERFELWFGQSTSLALAGDDLVVAAPSRFFRDFLRSTFRAEIETACFDTFGRPVNLVFQIDESLPNPSSQSKSIKLFDAAAADAKSADRKSADRKSASRMGKVAPRKFATLDGFVAGQSNQMVVSVARKAVEHPGHYSPLMFHGPTGVGKTHILEGIRTAARRRRGGPTAMYLTAEQFTTFFVDALRGSGLPSFRSKYRGADILIIDDIQFFRGKRSTLVELHYTIDILIREGRQVVLAADRPPSELHELGAELITRIEGGMITAIEPPDRATRLGIVAGLARVMADRSGPKIPRNVQEFIATRLTSHTRELSGALCRLQATAEAFDRPVTLNMAEETLSDMVRHSGRLVRLGDIQRAVCDRLGLEPDSLQSARKAKTVNHARMLAMWLARKHTRAALTEISSFFGRRSHSTVISAQRRVDGWIAAETPLQVFEDTSTIDETIRRIEQSLLAG